MLAYLKREKVLVIALALAALSMLLTPPDAAYLHYVDVRTLSLLLCLMTLVKGFQLAGLFNWLIGRVFSRVSHLRRLSQLLILMCFFSSMLITNDVALLTFVPFAILTLRLCNQTAWMIRVVVLQTVAANLGSLATPIGNPQNLYLFTASGMPAGEFFTAMLPLAAVSLLLVLLATLLIPALPISLQCQTSSAPLPRRDLGIYVALFALNLLVVFRVLPWYVALIATLAVLALMGRAALLRQADWALLMTFVGFFIFVGNLGRVPQLSAWLAKMLEGREVITAALFSQALSNVPTALLLSGFTDHWTALLSGVNIGGLGTLIASMASLISYKLYAAEPQAEKGRYLLVFTGYNMIGLVLLLLFELVLR